MRQILSSKAFGRRLKRDICRSCRQRWPRWALGRGQRHAWCDHGGSRRSEVTLGPQRRRSRRLRDLVYWLIQGTTLQAELYNDESYQMDARACTGMAEHPFKVDDCASGSQFQKYRLFCCAILAFQMERPGCWNNREADNCSISTSPAQTQK